MVSKLTPDQQKLLDHVPPDRGVGNQSLREALHWSRARYDQARQELVVAGEIALGRGRGGSVRRVASDDLALLRALPADGEYVSNADVMDKLRWPAEKYWAERARLLDQGLVIAGRGRGGRVARVVEETEEAIEAVPAGGQTATRYTAPAGADRVREIDLYPEIKEALRTGWCREMRFQDPVVETIAHLGRRNTGGQWSRPDLVVVGRRTYGLLPHTYFDICTFEVKPVDGWDLASLHEASAHQRFATKAYALFVVTDTLDDKDFAPYRDEAARLGVGLITATNPADYRTWDRVVEAEPTESDPQDLQDFLERSLTAEKQETIRGWWGRR